MRALASINEKEKINAKRDERKREREKEGERKISISRDIRANNGRFNQKRRYGKSASIR
jgi:hypothetical protein